MRAAEVFPVIDRPGVDPASAPGRPPLPAVRHEVIDHGTITQERDVAIALRDGVTIYADVYRSAAATEPMPVLLAWGPYGKHNTRDQLFPGADVGPDLISGHTGFEAPDPLHWCPRGYAVASVDPRGLWNSEGDARHNGPQEAEDIYDTVEFFGGALWSNGRVGMLGVSYLAGSQFIAAAMQPPSLKAISPWECFTDWYREFVRHGGIPETGFIPRASANMAFSRGRTEDTAANIAANPLLNDYYTQKYPPLAHITVPAYVVASWSDHGLHTRGTLEAFSRIASPDKWLEVHGQKKWRYFYLPEQVARQQQFFDHYLLDRGPGFADQPRVRLEIRDDESRHTHRHDISWPVDERGAERLWVDPAAGLLDREPPAASQVRFDSTTGRLDLSTTFADDTDVVGPMRLRLWLETEHADDADLFVAVRKFTADGREMRWPFNAVFEDGPVALGWLRASHRALDESASSELRPVHPHDREEPLTPGVPVPLEIEIWPSATRFRAGERLVVTVLGRDFNEREEMPGLPVTRHDDLRNAGDWIVHGGGEYDSFLSYLPLPARADEQP